MTGHSSYESADGEGHWEGEGDSSGPNDSLSGSD